MKKENLKKISSKLGVKNSQIQKVVDVLVREMAHTLHNEKRFRLPGIGLLKSDIRKGYIGRNPSTGEKVQVQPKLRVTLKTAPDFKRNLDSKLKKQQEDELKAYIERKEKEKVIPFDKEVAMAVPNKSETSVELPKKIPEPPMSDSTPLPPVDSFSPREEQSQSSSEPFAGEEPMLNNLPPVEDVHAGNGDFQKEFTIREIASQTAESVQKRMYLVFGIGAALLLLIVFVVVFAYLKSSGFNQFIVNRVNMVNEQNSYLTYEEIDKLVKDRMTELRLDVNQMKDQYKQELYALQDQTQKKIEAKVREDVRRELKRIKGGNVSVRSIKSGQYYIKIVRYKVRKGDNLWKIAEKKSRNPYNWVGIYQTNGRKIRNPHLIYPGQEILIPIIINNTKKKK